MSLTAYINKQGGTHSVEMHALLWNIMTWCHHYQITLKSQAHSRGPQCDGLPSIQSNKQNGHCIRRCSNSSVKWFFYCEKYTYHFLTIAICWCHPTHWPTLRNVLGYLKRPVSECELACPPSGHVTTLVNNLHYFCWPS